MKKKLNIIIMVILITFSLFAISRTAAIFERGGQAVGGELLLFLIPLIVWFVYCNIITTRQEFRDYELSHEAECADYIKNTDDGGAILITDINGITTTNKEI